MYQSLVGLVPGKPQERRALFLSFVYFFCLLCGYYLLRPIRDEMAVRVGVQDLHILIWLTFIGMLLTVPLFGWAMSRFSHANLIPAIYGFFILNLLFYFSVYYFDHLLDLSAIMQKLLAMSFFVWTGIYSLFVVSVFWSFMADIYDSASAQRLFGFISAGGTAGSLFGSLITRVITGQLSSDGSEAVSLLILLCACLLGVATVCVFKLSRWREKNKAEYDSAIVENVRPKASMWAAIPMLVRSPYLLGISMLVFLYAMLSTFLYFMQIDIVKSSVESSQQRIALFASIDLIVNSLTIVLQLFVTARIVKKIGLAYSLIITPLILLIGFMVVSFFADAEGLINQFVYGFTIIGGIQLPFLIVLLLAIQVIRRVGQYAINRPAREMLYTVVSTDEKYRVKNLIDTIVYRGGDAISGQVYAELAYGIGLKISAIAWIAVPVSGVWALVSFVLGKWHSRKSMLTSDMEINRV